jgi:hypothetical protein
VSSGPEFRRPRAHAIWTRRASHEEAAPDLRIIHTFHAGFGELHAPRVAIRPTRGYRKCGSRDEIDHIRDARVHGWDGSGWRLLGDLRDIPMGQDGEPRWLALDAAPVLGVLVEVRRSWVDDWWPSWNLVSMGVEVETLARDPDLLATPAAPMHADVDLARLPRGLRAWRRGGEVRYRSRYLEIGFRLGRPALSFLAFDADGLTDRPDDLLRHANLYEGDGNDWIANHPLFGQFALGPQLVTNDGMSHVGQFAGAGSGAVEVESNVVRYVLRTPSAGIDHELTWTVDERGFRLDAVRRSTASVAAIESSAWHLAFDCRVSPPCLLGQPERGGETGRTEPPALLHVPSSSSLEITAQGPVTLRFEAARPLMTTGLDIKLGERPTELGDYELAEGRAAGSVAFEVSHGPVPALRPGAPATIRRGIRRAWATGLTYRLDTTALSNNGNSIHVPASLELWGTLARAIGRVGQTRHAMDLVRDTVERYLDGAPGYGAGRTSFHPGLIQDEYIATDPSVLLGIAQLLAWDGLGTGWLELRGGQVRALIDRVRSQDVDGDGLIESTLRTGVTGRGDWSTNMCDIVSFGWKDAYTNAILFDALTRLEKVLPGPAWRETRGTITGWRRKLRRSFVPSFWNPATGWVAGWRSPDGALHDAGYVWVNGAVVEAGLLPPDLARRAISGLWNELRAQGFSDFRLGLPLNALSIPRGDMIKRFEGMPHGFLMPHGFNMNGAAALPGSRHFLAALWRVGMHAEADLVLRAAMSAIADGSAFGGCTSGVDLRTWDGTPCGYEGILTDQFGVVQVALQRYGANVPERLGPSPAQRRYPAAPAREAAATAARRG